MQSLFLIILVRVLVLLFKMHKSLIILFHYIFIIYFLQLVFGVVLNNYNIFFATIKQRPGYKDQFFQQY